MSYYVIQVTLAAAVNQNGTFTAAFPAGTGSDTFARFGHKMFARGLQAQFSQDAGTMSVAFTTLITVTYKGATPLPAGEVITLQVNVAGTDDMSVPDLVGMKRMSFAAPILIDLGAPITADADGISASQSVSSGDAALHNGAQGAVLDVPRNVVGAWTGTAVVTVTGKDEYGNVLVESSASGTSLTGKKAFKEITSIKPNANITSATFGFGDVLGLPVFASSGTILKEYEDGAAASAGTFVAGVQTTPTATTGDVRGTYDPNSACDGSKAFKLAVLLTDPTYKGVDQYAG